MRALNSFADYLDEVAMAFVRPIALMGAGLGALIGLRFGAIVLLSGPIALVLVGLGLTLDRASNSDLREICVILMIGIGWLLMWCFLVGMLVGGVAAWTK